MTEINGLDERISELKTLYQEAERLNLKNKVIELLVDINYLEELRELRSKQEPKTGHWIKEESPGWDGHSYQCSECGRSIHLDTEMEDLEDYPYCHCGAKMQEVQE